MEKNKDIPELHDKDRYKLMSATSSSLLQQEHAILMFFLVIQKNTDNQYFKTNKLKVCMICGNAKPMYILYSLVIKIYGHQLYSNDIDDYIV